MPGENARLAVLLAELKRRKVFRVAAVYGGAAFMVIQVADLVFPRLSLPDWTVTLVVVLALLGLAPALALAWAYEATSAGVRRAEPAAAGEIAAMLAQPRMRRWLAGVTALAGLLLLGGGAAWTLGLVNGGSGEYDSIAVLPFTNLSGDPENEYFGDGLAEELLNALAGIEGLKVAARTSAFAFKNTSIDVRAIGDTLRVATVLEGTVRRSADRIRISTQLVDARTGYHLWSGTYDELLSDLFVVQNTIARQIVNALAVRFTDAAGADRLHRGGTTDIEAYDQYLLGREKWTTRERPLLNEAVAHFEAAIARDSGFALAWSGLADALDAVSWRAGDTRRVPEAKRAAQIAISLDPELAEGWASLGVLISDFENDWPLAELSLRRAVQLRPSYAQAHHWLGDVYRYSGRAEAAVEAYRIAFELDPLSRQHHWGYARALAEAGRFEEAKPHYLRLREAGPQDGWRGVDLITLARDFGFTPEQTASYAREWAAATGYPRPEEAEVVGRAVFDAGLRAEALEALQRVDYNPRLLAAIGAFDEALDNLEQTAGTRPFNRVALLADAAFLPLREDLRFIRLRKGEAP
jgi:adenylate cyclase